MAATKKQKDLATAWAHAKKQLDEAKKLESELRQQVEKAFFPNGLEKGVNKADLDKGYIVKATPAFNYKLDEAQLPIVLKLIKEKFGTAPKCVKTKIELWEGEYNKLSDEVKEVFNECLTIKPGTTQIEITLPKR